jgi:peptidoglycan-N-acetylmuramic acid deacetylase
MSNIEDEGVMMMRKRYGLLAAALLTGTLAACSESPAPPAGPAVDATKGQPVRSVSEQHADRLNPAPPPRDEPEKGAGSTGSVTPETVRSDTYGSTPSSGKAESTANPPASGKTGETDQKPAAKPPKTDENKPLSWYYMKKKKGEVPNFPAEVKWFGPDRKAVWVGEGKKVYLTIDVGGELLDYEKLLQALRDNDVKATFFVTGYNLKNHPDYIRLLIKEGHVVGNHSITHKDFTTLTDDQVKQEIAEFEKLYKSIVGEEPPKLFRFPYGKYSLHLLELMTDLGYTSYFWSTAMRDWEPRKNGADDAYNDIINNLHDGNIILMHQASKENIEAMDRILKEIKKEGYEFGMIGDLAGGGK